MRNPFVQQRRVGLFLGLISFAPGRTRFTAVSVEFALGASFWGRLSMEESLFYF